MRLHDFINLPLTFTWEFQVLALTVFLYRSSIYLHRNTFCFKYHIHTAYLTVQLFLLNRNSWEKTAKSCWTRETIKVIPNCLSKLLHYCVCVWIYIFVWQRNLWADSCDYEVYHCSFHFTHPLKYVPDRNVYRHFKHENHNKENFHENAVRQCCPFFLFRQVGHRSNPYYSFTVEYWGSSVIYPNMSPALLK